MSEPIIISKKFSNGEMTETTAYSYPNNRFSTAEYLMKDRPPQDILPLDIKTRNTNEP